MASHDRRELTFVQSTYMRWQQMICALQALAESIRSDQSYKDAAWPFRRVFGVNFLKASHGSTSIDAQRDALPTTGDAIRSFCEKRGLKVHSHVVTCDQGPSAMLHEIPFTKHPHEPVFLYFHGGGYRKPLNPAAHMPIILESSEALKVGRTFCLEYGLTPGVQYPGQLYQAACALNLLLSQLDVQLSQIVIGGDSAGGNLVLALLAHMKQPHPSVPANNHLSGDNKLKGVILISPWVSNTSTAKSYTENGNKDYLSSKAMTAFADFWAPKDDKWADFLKAPEGFWKDLPTKNLYLSVGGFEVFRDDVRELAKLMDANKSSAVQYVEVPAEVHVQCGVDAALGLPHSKSLLEILQWCHSIS